MLTPVGNTRENSHSLLSRGLSAGIARVVLKPRSVGWAISGSAALRTQPDDSFAALLHKSEYSVGQAAASTLLQEVV